MARTRVRNAHKVAGEPVARDGWRLPGNGRDAVFWMSPDWSVMRALDGRGFLTDTDAPAHDWLDRYVHPDDHPLVSAAVQDAIKRKTVFELVHRVVRADGTAGWAYSRALPLLNRHGEISEWLGAASEHATSERAPGEHAVMPAWR